jgi:glycosyltransferase involved in cell wall biosynthesis
MAMRLLIVTQSVDRNDQILGFFHDWLAAFAAECTTINVIALRAGAYTLPPHVHVHVIGNGSRAARLWRFLKYAYALRHEYDAVLVHMNPEYVVAGGLLWRMLGKRIGLWFTHKSTALPVRIATVLADDIFTASPESFRIPSKKVYVTGHGILLPQGMPHEKERSGALELVTVGRLSPIKHYELMFDVLDALRAAGTPAHLTIVGGPATAADSAYEATLRDAVTARTLPVRFLGSVPHGDIARVLGAADVFINCSGTGSLDKAILEAWLAGLFVATTNVGVTSAAQGIDPALPFPSDAGAIATHIQRCIAATPERQATYRRAARAYVEGAHSLPGLVKKIVARLSGVALG